ncbi:MAG: hypothetical protein ACKVOR_13435 [Flavobacteriales bacterium]
METIQDTNPPAAQAGASTQKPASKTRLWLKRLGWAGFLFFLIKGIGWLVFFYFGGQALLDGCN